MSVIVYDLKSVEALKIEFVAPIPEQIGTSTMHFSNVSGVPVQGNALLRSRFVLAWVQQRPGPS